MPACAHAYADVSVWVTRGEHSQHGTQLCVLIVFIILLVSRLNGLIFL